MTLKITLPLLLLGTIFFHEPVHAQNHGTGTISGKLLDSATKEGLKGATLILRDGKDSARWKYSLSKEGGVFRMTELTPGPHTLFVSFQGHEGRTLPFSVNPSGGLVALGNIYLPVAPNTLDAVTVTATPGVR